jgi:hypothetical protein
LRYSGNGSGNDYHLLIRNVNAEQGKVVQSTEMVFQFEKF